MAVEFKKILFPTDFSELSRYALPYVKQVADWHDAQVYCLHVVDESYQNWSPVGPEGMPIVIPPGNLLHESCFAEAQQEMDRFVQQYLTDFKCAPIHKVVVGRPFVEIITAARDLQVDLIIMSTHGRGGLVHVLIGSTTEKVVRKAPCPVLTVRQPSDKFELP